jgi:hypothetical protein
LRSAVGSFTCPGGLAVAMPSLPRPLHAIYARDSRTSAIARRPQPRRSGPHRTRETCGGSARSRDGAVMDAIDWVDPDRPNLKSLDTADFPQGSLP